MQLRYQRFLYSFFFAVFFIAAPLLALYAAGYRYNWLTSHVEKTGLIVLDSIPSGAHVYLDDAYIDTTPTQITNLAPQEYNLTARLPGYYPWKQTATVENNTATFFHDIILFKQATPQLLIPGTVNIATINDSHETLLYSQRTTSTEQLFAFDLGTGKKRLILSLNPKTYSNLSFVSWSPNNQYALFKKTVGDFNTYLIVNPQTDRQVALFDISRLNFDRVIWGTLSDNQLYGLRQKTIYRIDLIDHSTQTLVTDATIIDYTVRNRWLYFTTINQQQALLHRQPIFDNQFDQVISRPLKPTANYYFKPSPVNQLALLDTLTQNMLVIPTITITDEQAEIVPRNSIPNANLTVWSTDNQTLLTSNGSDLYAYRQNTTTPELISHDDSRITQLTWYNLGSTVLYQRQGIIQSASAAKDYDNKNNTELATFDTATILGTNENHTLLYIYGRRGAVEGIFSLQLQ